MKRKRRDGGGGEEGGAVCQGRRRRLCPAAPTQRLHTQTLYTDDTVNFVCKRQSYTKTQRRRKWFPVAVNRVKATVVCVCVCVGGGMFCIC